jgi:hypothetical protein
MFGMDQRVVEKVREDIAIEDIQMPQLEGALQTDSVQSLGTSRKPESMVIALLMVGETTSPPMKIVPNVAKGSKASLALGILQKDLKKGTIEKPSKTGRKKDFEKIKLMGETLVESGYVKTLDSHFSNPPK